MQLALISHSSLPGHHVRVGTRGIFDITESFPVILTGLLFLALLSPVGSEQECAWAWQLPCMPLLCAGLQLM